MSGPTLWPPALAQSRHDRRLTPLERVALMSLWQDLSSSEWLPMKAEVLGLALGIKRQSAARIMRRLIECGYLLSHQTHPREQRLFLLVNVIMEQRAA